MNTASEHTLTESTTREFGKMARKIFRNHKDLFSDQASTRVREALKSDEVGTRLIVDCLGTNPHPEMSDYQQHTVIDDLAKKFGLIEALGVWSLQTEVVPVPIVARTRGFTLIDLHVFLAGDDVSSAYAREVAQGGPGQLVVNMIPVPAKFVRYAATARPQRREKIAAELRDKIQERHAALHQAVRENKYWIGQDWLSEPFRFTLTPSDN